MPNVSDRTELNPHLKILLRTHYGVDEGDTKKVGIARLLRKRAYKAAYPLHDGRWNDDPDDLEGGEFQRQQQQGGGAPCERRVRIRKLSGAEFNRSYT